MPESLEPSRQQIEEWRQRVRDAKLQLDLSRQYLREVQRDLDRGSVSTSDGNHALQHAMRAENLALDHYLAVVEQFTELVVHGQIPSAGKSAGG